jgi:ABC-type multidrug transport system ATPase subunit
MNVVDVKHISKTFEGREESLRGTKLEAKGIALWLRNASRSLQLTTNQAPPVKALQDVSLHIAPGEIFGLVGRNGSGKTTLIKILAGLIRPTAGSGQVTGISLDLPQEIRKRVSYVSTTGWMGLEWPLTAEENIRCFATLCGMPGRLARERTAEALRDVEMWENRQKYPSQLSNGMRQRTILARALLFRTPLLLLDEPTVGLDPITVQTVLELMRRRLRERGQTILLADHQSTEMEAVADRIAVLEAGEVVMQGTPSNLLGRLSDLTVIEIHTEEMDRPLTPPPALVTAVQHAEPPGALGLRTWRIHAHKQRDALDEVLRWIAQPTGRIVFLAESAPTFHDVLALPAPPEQVTGAASQRVTGA